MEQRRKSKTHQAVRRPGHRGQRGSPAGQRARHPNLHGCRAAHRTTGWPTSNHPMPHPASCSRPGIRTSRRTLTVSSLALMSLLSKILIAYSMPDSVFCASLTLPNVPWPACSKREARAERAHDLRCGKKDKTQPINSASAGALQPEQTVNDGESSGRLFPCPPPPARATTPVAVPITPRRGTAVVKQ